MILELILIIVGSLCLISSFILMFVYFKIIRKRQKNDDSDFAVNKDRRYIYINMIIKTLIVMLFFIGIGFLISFIYL